MPSRAENLTPTSRSTRLLGNIGALALARMASTLTSFALLPLVIRYLGTETYGLYVLLQSIAGYFTVLDFGVAPAVIKYVAEYHGRGDVSRVRRLINSAFTYYLLIGAVAAASLLALSVFAERIFHFDAAQKQTVDRLFQIAALATLLLWPTGTFRSVMEGLQRYRASALVGAATQIGAAMAGVVALAAGAGVTTFFAIMLAGTLAGNLVLYAMARRDDPGLRLVPTRDGAAFREIFGFSTYIFIGSLASLAVFQLDHVIVGAFVSVSAVALYNVAYLLHAAVKTADNLIAAPAWSATAEMEGRNDLDGQRRLFLRGTRFVTAFFLPAVLLLVVFADPLIPQWMGPGFADSVLPARILVAGWLVASLWQTGVGVLTAKGIVRRLTAIACVNGGLNLLLSATLVRPLGIAGVALGTTIPFIIVMPLVWKTILGALGMRFAEVYVASIHRGWAPLVGAGLAGFAILELATPPSLALTLTAMAATYLLAAGLAYTLAIEPDDRSALRGYLGGLLRRERPA